LRISNQFVLRGEADIFCITNSFSLRTIGQTEFLPIGRGAKAASGALTNGFRKKFWRIPRSIAEPVTFRKNDAGTISFHRHQTIFIPLAPANSCDDYTSLIAELLCPPMSIAPTDRSRVGRILAGEGIGFPSK
jgi:hypothetical protein